MSMVLKEFLKSKGIEVVNQVSILELNKYMEIGKEPCTSGIYQTLFAKKQELMDKLDTNDLSMIAGLGKR